MITGNNIPDLGEKDTNFGEKFAINESIEKLTIR
jgi:hypothetical protein